MRILLVVTLLAVSASLAQAQDPSQQAIQANQQAMQASQQAMQQAQEANAQAQQAAQQAMQDSQSAAQAAATNSGAPYYALKPKFSVKPGTFAAPTTVKIKDATRGAIIYYTTNGWSPTEASQRYLGPIKINSTTTLQAIAIVPYGGRSFIASGEYIISGTNSGTPPTTPAAIPAAGNAPDAGGAPSVLHEGTPVNFIFAGEVSSKTAEVGDKVPLTLAEDLTVGTTVIAKKGAPGMATVIGVDKPAAGGLPGNLVFQVDSLSANGTTVALRGSEEKEGQAKPPNATVLIPLVGPLTIFKHGKQAEIAKGTPVTAYVDSDTALSLFSWPAN